MRSCYHGYFALCFLYMMIVVSWYGVYMIMDVGAELEGFMGVPTGAWL